MSQTRQPTNPRTYGTGDPAVVIDDATTAGGGSTTRQPQAAYFPLSQQVTTSSRTLEPETIEDVSYNSTVENMDHLTRLIFTRKVFSVLLAQFGLTIAAICLTLYHDESAQYCSDHSDIRFVGAIVGAVVLIPPFCFVTIRDSRPWNILILTLFTIFQAFEMGVLAGVHHSEALLQAYILLSISTLTFVLFSFQTSRDFKGGVWSYLTPLLFGITLFGAGRFAFPGVSVIDSGIAIASAVIAVQLMVFDLMGLFCRLTPAEWLSASLSLYLDLPNIIFDCLALATRHTRQT